jgi:hypothetical protein
MLHYDGYILPPFVLKKTCKTSRQTVIHFIECDGVEEEQAIYQVLRQSRMVKSDERWPFDLCLLETPAIFYNSVDR